MESESPDVYQVAKYQKYILYCFLANILLNILYYWSSFAMPAEIDAENPSHVALMMGHGAVMIVQVVILVVTMILTFRLAKALKSAYPILWSLGLLLGFVIPLISLLLLVILIVKASNVIKAAGYKVGIMGANLKEIQGVVPSA